MKYVVAEPVRKRAATGNRRLPEDNGYNGWLKRNGKRIFRGSGVKDVDNSKTRRHLFISHKHADADLAKGIADLMRELSGGSVDIFRSSSYGRDRTGRYGFGLTEELKAELGRAGVVLLVYTDPAGNWEWCLWECGVATNPNDTVPTKVVVFAVNGELPRQYQSEKHLIIDYTDESTLKPLTEFCRQYCRSEDFWLDDGGPVNPGLQDAQIKTIASNFFSSEQTKRELRDIANGLDESLADDLSPLLRNSVRALKWGRDVDQLHSELFQSVWNRYRDEFQGLSERRLVFRPPFVENEWERLLKLAESRLGELDFDLPAIRLVSWEDDPVGYWVEAMRNPVSSSGDYEEPVRKVAKALRSKIDRIAVERRFLVPRDYFRSDETIDLFERIVDWMKESEIAVSVRNNHVNSKLKDFGVIAELAVSTFDSTRELGNRTLEQDFSPDTINLAMNIWNSELAVDWVSTSEVAFREFIEASGRRL